MSKKNKQSKQTHSSKRKWLIVVVCALLFLVGVTGGWAYNYVQQKTAEDKAVKQEEKRTATVNKAENDALNIVEEGGEDSTIKAAAVYDTVIKQAAAQSDSDLKYRLLMDKATLYFNEANYQRALNVALEAEAVIKNANVEQFIAQIYESMGDKPNAAKYYKSAISLVDKSLPMADSDTKYYQSKVNELGG